MRCKRSTTHPAVRQPRPVRRVPEDSPCPDCGASYRDGRWTWQPTPPPSYKSVCPACERIASRYPAGVLHVEGAFAAPHRDELIALVRNVEERERADHPLKRVMTIETTEDGFVAETNDAKLVQTLGRALRKAYAGRLVHSPTTAEKDNLVRVRWIRD